MTRYSSRAPIPARLGRLEELATDLWWSWHPEARIVFRRLDYTLWRSTAHNPVRMLWTMPRARLEQAAADEQFLAVYDRAILRLDDARTSRHTATSTVRSPRGTAVTHGLPSGVSATSIGASAQFRRSELSSCHPSGEMY